MQQKGDGDIHLRTMTKFPKSQRFIGDEFLDSDSPKYPHVMTDWYINYKRYLHIVYQDQPRVKRILIRP